MYIDIYILQQPFGKAVCYGGSSRENVMNNRLGTYSSSAEF